MNIELIVGIFVFLGVLGAIAIFGFRFYTRPERILDQLGSPRLGDFSTQGVRGTPSVPKYRINKVLQWVGERIPADPVTASFTQRLLMAAGFRSSNAFHIFLGSRLAGAVLAGLVILTVVPFSAWHPLLKILSVVGSVGVGFWVPTLILEYLVERRQGLIRSGLPDALDMLVVCVEAGISLDQALRMVSEELNITHPELCQDLRLISTEMRTGLGRAHALKNFADRTMEPEVAKLVSILIQTDRFGTSIGDSLRTHSEVMRVRRRQFAEEKAGKLSVQLIFPVFFCILPGILVLAAGPAFLQIFNQLLPAMQVGGS